jgi:hypothetical protein
VTTSFFCADAARQSGVDPISTASNYKIYIVIECPPPWTPNELASKSVPANLRSLGETVGEDYDQYQTCFLLIHNEALKQPDYTRLLIFHHEPGLAQGYHQQEFHIQDINEIAPLVQAYLAGEPIHATPVTHSFRDILICTHGSHDRCCAKYGYPIYREALKIANDRSLNHVRIWQASHIGGHRFAPTAIDLPEGRYYGHLDASSLASILTRSGDVHALKQVYRGWGCLPWAVQALERELLFQYGWDWFNHKVAFKILHQDENEIFTSVELTVELPTGDRHQYKAEIVAEQNKAVYLKGSCDADEEFPFPQYVVQKLIRLPS